MKRNRLVDLICLQVQREIYAVGGIKVINKKFN